MDKFLVSMLFGLCLGLAPKYGIASTETIYPVKDKSLVSVLNNFEIILEKTEFSFPYRIKLIRNWEIGECGPTPESCPMSKLYISISTHDSAPEQNLYLLGKKYGWKFSRWILVPKQDGPTKFLELELIAKEISDNIKKGWWQERKYRITINPWRVILQEVK